MTMLRNCQEALSAPPSILDLANIKTGYDSYQLPIPAEGTIKGSPASTEV
jgi:hypothetical protein